MTTQERKSRKWYQKKRYILPLALVGSMLVIGTFSDTGTQSQPVQSSTNVLDSLNVSNITQVAPARSISVPSVPTQQVPLSNDNYYTNSAGNQVHSPAYAPSIPAGASAQCRDGTYSFSQSRRGTCSHHGGVARWL